MSIKLVVLTNKAIKLGVELTRQYYFQFFLLTQVKYFLLTQVKYTTWEYLRWCLVRLDRWSLKPGSFNRKKNWEEFKLVFIGR